MTIIRMVNGEIHEFELTKEEIKQCAAVYEDSPYWWGIVRWCEDDVIGCLEDHDIEPTPENVREVKDNLGHMEDEMIEIGWDCIDTAVWNLKWKIKEGEE